jgi:hypothetical protein
LASLVFVAVYFSTISVPVVSAGPAIERWPGWAKNVQPGSGFGEEAAMKPAYLGSLCLLATLGGCAGEDSALRQGREIAALRMDLQQAREEARANRLACQAEVLDRERALSSARQLRADTQYLRTSTSKMSDAVTRLNYEDWNKVVPEVQLAFGDVENAANDLDSRVGRVLIALRADAAK